MGGEDVRSTRGKQDPRRPLGGGHVLAQRVPRAEQRRCNVRAFERGLREPVLDHQGSPPQAPCAQGCEARLQWRQSRGMRLLGQAQRQALDDMPQADITSRITTEDAPWLLASRLRGWLWWW